jgi:hypothetical protein
MMEAVESAMVAVDRGLRAPVLGVGPEAPTAVAGTVVRQAGPALAQGLARRALP